MVQTFVEWIVYQFGIDWDIVYYDNFQEPMLAQDQDAEGYALAVDYYYYAMYFIVQAAFYQEIIF